jgi:hypothetical protein
MSLVLFFTLALAVLFYLALPIFGEPYWPCRENSPLSEIKKEKRNGIWAIADVDSEYEMGKLTESDYTELRNHLKNELLLVMNKEKELMQSGGRIPEKDIRPELKNELLVEVARICGLKHS